MRAEHNEDMLPEIIEDGQLELDDDFIDSLVLENKNDKELSDLEIRKIIRTIANLETRTTANIALLDQEAGDNNGSSPVANSVEMYHREVGKFDLLTSDEEIALTRGYKRAITELTALINPTPEEPKEDDDVPIPQEVMVTIEQPTEDDPLSTEDRARAHLLEYIAEKTKEHLINHNLRLAFSIAKSYQFRGMPLIDLLQEANVGLQKGVEKYNPELGYKLSTYATFWIKQNISRELANKGTIIRLPVHQHDLVKRVTATQNRLKESLEREPTSEEIAAELEISASAVVKAFESRRVASVTSINTPVSDDPNPDELEGFIVDKTVDIEEEIENAMRDSDVRSLLETLEDRERDVLMERFGIGTGKQRTFQELADKYRISRERVRQIEAKALHKLRSTARKRNLDDYLA